MRDIGEWFFLVSHSYSVNMIRPYRFFVVFLVVLFRFSITYQPNGIHAYVHQKYHTNSNHHDISRIQRIVLQQQQLLSFIPSHSLVTKQPGIQQSSTALLLQRRRGNSSRKYDRNDIISVDSLDVNDTINYNNNPATSNCCCWIIDVENVRGKSGFTLSHAELLRRIRLWIQQQPPPPRFGNVILVVDHGSEASKLWIPEDGYSMVFSGPGRNVKADDTIVLDIVPYVLSAVATKSISSSLRSIASSSFSEATVTENDATTTTIAPTSLTHNVIAIVTGDEQLIQRCLRCVTTTSVSDTPKQQGTKMKVIPPATFLTELERYTDDDDEDDNDNTSHMTETQPEPTSSGADTMTPEHPEIEETIKSNGVITNNNDKLYFVEHALKLGSELLEIEYLLLRRHNHKNYDSIAMTAKRRKKLIVKRKKIVDVLLLRQQKQMTKVQSFEQQETTSNDSRETTKQQTKSDDSNRIVQLILDTIADIHTNGKNSILLQQNFSSIQQQTLLSRYEKLIQNKKQRFTKHRKETTDDRTVLAENLRLDVIEQLSQGTTPEEEPDDTNILYDNMFRSHANPSWLAQSYVRNSFHDDGNVMKSNNVQNYDTRTIRSEIFRSKKKSNGFQQQPVLLNGKDMDESLLQTFTVGSLRLVVISDTHGFEEQLLGRCQQEDSLSSMPATLPDGDILLHLGDFAIDRLGRSTERSSAIKFDTWLSRQPHKMKIVVRGNHDPRSFSFSKSGALYITQPCSRMIGNYKFAFVPYQSCSGLRKKSTLTPSSCDVLVSHVPPREILDKCCSGKNAGSRTIRSCVERMKAGPPFLWLCGHIHEGRGVVKDHIFCGQQQTTIINAANANFGIARSLNFGPTIVQLGNDKTTVDENDSNNNSNDNSNNDILADRNERLKKKDTNKVRIIEMDGRYTFMNQKYESFFGPPDIVKSDIHEASGGERQVLLAVDLGLRTGMCLFSDSGHILHYDYFHFATEIDMKVSVPKMLLQWEQDMNDHSNKSNHLANVQVDKTDGACAKQWKISHIAVEGHDASLQKVWREIVGDSLNRNLLFVQPEDWRNDLLTRDERLSGESSKHASRIIAKQIISDYRCDDGMILHPKNNAENDCIEAGRSSMDLQTDMAESILLGYHVARRLSWVPVHDPPVRRTPKEGIVIPEHAMAGSSFGNNC